MLATTLSLPVISGLIRVVDLALLCVGGMIATLLVKSLYGAIPEGLIILASVIGSMATTVSLAHEGAYRQDALLSLATQVRLLPKPLVIGVFCIIASFFLLYQGPQYVRMWLLIWAVAGGALIVLARLGQTRLLIRPLLS